MKLLRATLLITQLLAASALAMPHKNGGGKGNGGNDVAAGDGAAAGGETAAGGEEEEAGLEQEGAFGTPIELTGGDVQIDTNYPPGVNGALEIEFANPDARTLTVSENKTPGMAPAGFDFVEPVSYIVKLDGGSQGLTLQKVDYKQTAGNTLDISGGVLGKLCADTNTFMVGAAIGETEFEADELELTTPVTDLNGEFAYFVPSAGGAAATGGAAAGGAGAAAGGQATGGAATCTTQLCQLLALLGLQ